MTRHEEFTTWVAANGVKINGVKVHDFDGRGLGIMAERRLEAGTVLVNVPHTALRTQDSINPNISNVIGRVSVHGLLAADEALGASPEAWRAILPSSSDLQECMPLCWPAELQELLPLRALKLLRHQQQKFNSDWAATSKAFPALDREHYLHSWLLVNTRTFYYVSASHRGPAPDRDDCMALNPFADCFNHSSSPSAEVKYSQDAFLITCQRDIEADQEVYISYGNHSNDFLLVEYGFILEDNLWDEVLIDAYVLPLLSTTQQSELADAGFLGNYILDRNTVCYRTQVALRSLCLPAARWKRFVSGIDDGERDQPIIDRVIYDLLIKYRKDIAQSLLKTSSIDDAFINQKRVLERRWEQVDQLFQVTLDRIQN